MLVLTTPMISDGRKRERERERERERRMNKGEKKEITKFLSPEGKNKVQWWLDGLVVRGSQAVRQFTHALHLEYY